MVLRQVLGRRTHSFFHFRSSKPKTFITLGLFPFNTKEPTDSPIFYRTQGLAQPAYQAPQANNWFTTPQLPNNIHWAMVTATEQYKFNQIAYPKKGWPTYPNGLYKTKLDATTSPPITDWVAGAEPNWTSIAGGKGWGKSPGKEVKGAAPVAAGPPGTLAVNSSSSAPTTVPISASKQVPAPTPKPTPSRLAAQEDDTCEA